jgi:hypothetical protein
MTNGFIRRHVGPEGAFMQKRAVPSCKKTWEHTINRALIFEMGFLVNFSLKIASERTTRKTYVF